jgi:hypothetical protein
MNNKNNYIKSEIIIPKKTNKPVYSNINSNLIGMKNINITEEDFPSNIIILFYFFNL